MHYIEDTKFKTNTISFVIHRPLSREHAAKNALLPMILKRGSALYPTLSDIELRLQELYGAVFEADVTKKGEDQLLSFSIQTIQDCYTPDRSEVLPLAVGLMLSVIFDPLCENGVFKADYVASEKRNLADMMGALINDKRKYASLRCISEMCKDEPFGVHEYGDPESLDKIDEKNLYAHYKTVLSASRLDIFLCGSADVSKIAAQLQAGIPAAFFADAAIPQGEICRHAGQVSYVTEALDVGQAKLALGLRTNTPPAGDEYFHLAVANSVLGSGVHSKLFNNVREKLGLAYYASSILIRNKALMIISMGIEQDNYQKALDETLFQLEKLKGGEVSGNEFESAKVFLTGLARAANDDQYALTDFHLSALVCGWQGGIEQHAERISRTTLQQAVAAAKKIELDTVYLLKGRDHK